jgi:phage terminase large subunit GpA-like protein
MTPLPDLPPYVSGFSILRDALNAMRPRQRVSVQAWTGENRYMRGATPGLWDPSVAPYLEEPMAQFDAPGIEEIVVAGPGRCGKTVIGENVLLKTIKADSAPVGWYANTSDVMQSYVKMVVNPLLDDHHCDRAPGDNTDSLSTKRFFSGTTAEFLAATDSALRNKTFKYIVADEFDGYDPALGDARGRVNQRRASYLTAGRTLFISHPDLAVGLHPSGWRQGVMGIYAGSTRCTWWWQCPECGGFSSPNPGTVRHMELVYPDDAPLDEIAEKTALACPCCGALLEDRHRRAMNLTGRWIGQGENIAEDGTVTGTRPPNSVAGYWIVGVMSPFLLGGIGGLARARVAAERAVAADEDGAERMLRQVLTKQWGYPYTAPRSAAALDAEVLADRAEEGLKLHEVPDGVRFLMTAIDVQADRFEVLTRGFGPGFESWVIDHRQIAADPSHSLDDWHHLLTEELARTYPLADGSGRMMRVRCVGFDSGGEPGVTENAYEIWKRLRAAHKARYLGQVSGRDVFTALPLKGRPGLEGSRLVVTYPDSKRKDRTAAARGEVPVGIFLANAFRDAVYAQLSSAEPGARYVHFPAALRGAWPDPDRAPVAPHKWFEQLVAEQRDPVGHWSKVRDGVRNEAWDLMVMTQVLAHLHASRIDWARPPAWAAAWDVNTMVRRPTLPSTPAPSAPAPSSAYVPRGRALPASPIPAALAAQAPRDGLAALAARLAQ